MYAGRLKSVVNFVINVFFISFQPLSNNDEFCKTILFALLFLSSLQPVCRWQCRRAVACRWKDVTKQEFELYCKHHLAGNCRTESVQNAFDDFLFQKLKSADMRRTGCDTLPAFRQYCKVMQGELLKTVMLDKEQEERACRDLYRQSVERLSKADG